MRRHSHLRILLILAAIFCLSAAAPLASTANAQDIPGDPPSNPQATSEPPVTPPNPPGGGSVSPQSPLQRISFEPGATNAQVSGRLPANGVDRYVLWARAGQLMEVTLSAPAGVSLEVTRSEAPQPRPLHSASQGFRGYLPHDGDYILKVRAGSRAADYSLLVSIPARIAFKPGATSDTVRGHLDPHESIDYILRAQAGQLLEVQATPENRLQLIVYGVDGTVMRSGMGEGSSFIGELPVTQDYILTLRAGARAVDFTLQVIIPQRIRFEPGERTAFLRGQLDGDQTGYYVLQGQENQYLRVSVAADEAVQLIIYGEDGTVLRSGMSAEPRFAGRLPSTQNYILELRAGPEPVDYRLWLKLRGRGIDLLGVEES